MRRLAACALAVAAAGGAIGCGGDDGGGNGTATAQTATTATGGTLAQVPGIVKKVQPSVVTVISTLPQGQGEGAGVAWSPHVVVTNNHVVENATSVRVVLAGGRRVDAKVRATDPRRDLALVEVDGADLPPATFAGQVPDVGSLAVAIGSPLGFEQSVTAGIISGVDRAIPSGGRTPALVGLLQTDAAISPGNSGGALVDADGRVVGINVAYIPPQGGAVSLGFAIPSPTVRTVVPDLLDDGHAANPYLGIRSVPLTPGEAQQLGVSSDHGLVVLQVEPGSPADDAGLQGGDVLLTAAGQRLDALEDLYSVMAKHRPGDRLDLQVLRDGDQRSLTVTLGERPTTATTG
ncbi:MAG TPA: trypsin-like peptidase domain-containing protein [Baekduia sp.]|nr:trypsin-like peptidase domain-containing protein [Baekduia sp.]